MDTNFIQDSSQVVNALGEEDALLLQQKLQNFLECSNSHWVALGDRAGTLLFHEGRDPGSDTAILCALAAGSFAASRELARRLGANEFGEQVHEGEGMRILLHALDNDTLLIVVFQPTTSIGLVRYYAAKLSQELNEIILRVTQHHQPSSDLLSASADKPFA